VVADGVWQSLDILCQPGRYEFVDEYNEKTARGALVVKQETS